MKTITNSKRLAPMPAANRSAKTNGRRRFVDGDGRSPWGRRNRDLQELYADDLGGAATLSQFQIDLLTTAATLRCELERLEGCLSLGRPIDLDLFGRIAGHYRRCCETLGVERRARDTTPDLQTYLAAKATT